MSKVSSEFFLPDDIIRNSDFGKPRNDRCLVGIEGDALFLANLTTNANFDA